MNLFVIMPFAPEFDDVYVSIKRSAEGALAADKLRCFRLDETRAAGRITDRLIDELESAAICVADLTGLRPNIMWEVGYAMALGKPTILITQDKADLPFDVRDMQSICYERHHLNSTLERPLAQCVLDTVRHGAVAKTPGTAPDRDELVGGLLNEIRGLKDMLGAAVKAWNPPAVMTAPAGEPPPALASLEGLEGAWMNEETGTHLYARIIAGDLVAAYCYGGDDRLKAAYYGWRRTGEYWFARFQWFEKSISGFTFLKHESRNMLVGAWWSDMGVRDIPTVPELGSGIQATWVRLKRLTTPPWAEQFFAEVRREGLEVRLARARR